MWRVVGANESASIDGLVYEDGAELELELIDDDSLEVDGQSSIEEEFPYERVFRDVDLDEELVPEADALQSDSKDPWSDRLDKLRRLFFNNGVSVTTGTAILKYLSDVYPQDNY